MRKNSHPHDSELLLTAERELSSRRAKQLEEHLAQCKDCRERKRALEMSMRSLVSAREEDPALRLPAPESSRAMLRARLAAAAVPPESHHHGMALSAACAFALLLLAVFGPRFFDHSRTHVVSVPNRRLTPGLAMPVSRDQLCSATPAKNAFVPAALRRQVFAEYGIQQAEPQAYEVDYLITPALGGADDIRNLWPQSYTSTVWNAKVKDALEDRLHDLVCEGQVDLATAQRDIAADWVTAYKKYFHTDKPIAQ